VRSGEWLFGNNIEILMLSMLTKNINVFTVPIETVRLNMNMKTTNTIPVGIVMSK